ncbi:hypothetical protein AVEN_191098-1 [Araneus ventricosus]|uniref:Uncharacterized protein n=1 Tax=Araneus ventricosus TaxID=182803 RepID=A0A4Y2AY04_ARAVE|nr:hypothetical protein AVEN_191098-1 [Araneus ventricosus]
MELEKESDREHKEIENSVFLKKVELEMEAKRIKLTTGESVKSSLDVHHLIQKFDQKLKKSEGSASLNWVIGVPDNDLSSPYPFIDEVNVFKMPIIRDSGTTVGIVCRNIIISEMFTGEHICYWPLAEEELKGEFGQVKTKAAVVCSQVDKGRYLLGNRTTAWLGKKREGLIFHQVKALQPRAQKQMADQ